MDETDLLPSSILLECLLPDPEFRNSGSLSGIIYGRKFLNCSRNMLYEKITWPKPLNQKIATVCTKLMAVGDHL